MDLLSCTIEFRNNEELRYRDNLQDDTLDGRVNDDPLLRATTKRLIQLVVESPQVCVPADYALLGAHLYRLLFEHPQTAKLRDAFHRLVARFDSDLRRKAGTLRVILSFDRHADLVARYPWEFLSIPATGQKTEFLAGQREGVVMSRRVPEVRRWDEEVPAPPLRVLVAAASPPSLKPVKYEDVLAKIRELADVTVKQVIDPHREQLKQAIAEFQPHAVHFVGHGQRGGLALPRSSAEQAEARTRGDHDPYAIWGPSEVIDLFQGAPVRMVFLHACETDRSITDDRFEELTTLARELVYSHVQVVVAMQYEIPNREASHFACEFYRCLNQGMNVDDAARSARMVLGRTPPVWGHRRFGTPVVYQQSREPLVRAASPARARKVECPCACSGTFVYQTDRACPVTGEEIVKCPNPRCEEMIWRRRGSCVACGSRLGEPASSQDSMSIKLGAL